MLRAEQVLEKGDGAGSGDARGVVESVAGGKRRLEVGVEKVEAAATNMTEARALLEMVRAGHGTS